VNKSELAGQLVIDEDIKLRLYRDTVGKLTGGVGHNFDDLGISRAAAMFILDEDIDIACAELDKALPWWRGMSEQRQQAIANMAFNMGVPKLLGFKNTLAAMKAGDYESAANEMLNSKWATQVGERAKRLAKMMRNG
jgi:lysozyme